MNNTTIIRRLAQLIKDLKILGAISKDDGVQSRYSTCTKTLYLNIYIKSSLISDLALIEKAFKNEFADCHDLYSIQKSNDKFSFELKFR